jgi:two-component system, NtrC family, response regulator GlrR
MDLKTVPTFTPALRTERIRSFRVDVIEGPDQGREAKSKDARITIGRAADSSLALTDRTVSEYHLECEVVAKGIRVRDLGSTNGSQTVDGIAITDVTVFNETRLKVGDTTLRIRPGGAEEIVAISASTNFCGMFGASSAMRSAFARLLSAAPTMSAALVLGESGTGKELAAHALHLASPRAEGPFEIVHCGSLPPTLIESELFGHTRGSFTNAMRDYAGAFERANKGTIFLDEIGELPLESQPKLLRVLESGHFRRVGGSQDLHADVRVVAATNRDLRAEVNAGRFRADLYFRLAVIQVRLPPLRERMDDLPELAQALIAKIRSERKIQGNLVVDAELLRDLNAYGWPGNVRELRNYLEQWLVLRERPERFEDSSNTVASTSSPPTKGTLREVRDESERVYLTALLKRCGWQIQESAKEADIDRATLFRLMRKHDIRQPE